VADSPRVTVVVCVHNGGSVLSRALEALEGQTLEPGDYEVLVVDDGSRDDTAVAASRPSVALVRLDRNVGLAAARNVGVANAHGEIVAFTDADCEPDPAWLERLLEPFADRKVNGVSGSVVPAAVNTPARRYAKAREPLAPLPRRLLPGRGPSARLGGYLRAVAGVERALAGGDELYSVVGANMAFRRAFLECAGGFDPAFRFGGEEEELCRRAHKELGAVFVYQPAARVRHAYEPGFRDTFRRARAYGIGNARLAAKHREVRHIVYPFPLALTGLLAILVRARRWRALPALAALPLLLYPRWTLAALRGCRGEAAFAYVQLAEEVATMLGEWRGYLLRVSGRPYGRRGRAESA
jgi:GT2 family glycosyltransferase